MASTATVVMWPLLGIKDQLGPVSEELALEHNQELMLDDPDYAYLTRSKHHQLFCVDLTTGHREHLANCPAGQFLMGDALASSGPAKVLMLTGVPDGRVWRVPMTTVADLATRPDGGRRIGQLLDSWVRLLLDALPEEPIPPDGRTVRAGETVGPGHACIRSAGDLCWIAPARPPTRYRGMDLRALTAPVDSWPLREDTVAVCPEGGFRVWSTAELLAADPTASFSRSFAALVIRAVGQRRDATAGHRLERDRASAEAEKKLLEASLVKLARVGRAEGLTAAMVAEGDDLSVALGFIHHELGMSTPHPEPRGGPGGLPEIEAMLSRSRGARSRPVLLQGAWWTSAGGPLLGFLGEEAGPGLPGSRIDLRPVALLPVRGRYRLLDPQRPRRGGQPLDAEGASRLHPQAHQFYRSLPEKMGRLGLLRFLARGSGRDLLQVAVIGTLVGLLGLLIPLVTGLVFDRIVPGAERSLLLQIVGVLVAVYLGALMFDLAQGFALIRLQTRSDLECEAAVWDHLLRLPMRFFRRYSAGDLASRVDGIAGIREALAGATLTSLLGGIFSLGNLGLLFYIDATLASACAVLVLVAGLTTAVVGAHQLAGKRRVAEMEGRLAGLLFQLLRGIAKLRTAGAERRAFGVWANLFAGQRSAQVKLAGVATGHGIFSSVYPLVCLGVLFHLLLWRQGLGRTGNGLSAGQFLTFHAAFGVLLAAVSDLLTAMVQVVGVVPRYERARPILREPQESVEARAPLGELSGGLEISHLSFRYHKDARLVLDDLSLRIEPGQFVAIVGPSGSGKSTLLKLLLGLETSSSGHVYYDGKSLSSLDVHAVRQQIGVVLQSDGIFAGSIYENIAGTSGADLASAWEAAKMAALEKDIQAMPMGMFTLLAQGHSTLSGGQQQRLLIARALARRPKMLFFDEATSALDNETQAQVTSALDRLKVTRVVIAHRLATIVGADQIVVLDRGHIVQQGTYPALLAAGGLFRTLVERQLF